MSRAPISLARTSSARPRDDYIEVFNTPALELLENFPHRNLDIVFVAANAAEYGAYLDAIVPMLKLSGLAIFSDALATQGFAERFLSHPARGLGARGGQLAIGARHR